MARRGGEAIVSLGEVARQVAEPLLERPTARAALVFRHWDRAVGEQMARHTEPGRLAEGVLTVRVSSPVWAHQLSFLKPELLERLHTLVPEAGIRDLRFQSGRLRKRGALAEPERLVLLPALPEEVARAEALAAPIGDESLRVLFARVVRKFLVRRRMGK